MRPSHGRRSKAFQNFSRARDHDSESQSPQAAAHQVHADQTGNEKVDVTSTRFSYLLFASFHCVGAALSTLQDIVNHEPGGTTLRPRWIKTIFKSVVLR